MKQEATLVTICICLSTNLDSDSTKPVLQSTRQQSVAGTAFDDKPHLQCEAADDSTVFDRASGTS
jgi:hypothetical protein